MNKLFKIITICLCIGLITSSAAFANVEFTEISNEDLRYNAKMILAENVSRTEQNNFIKVKRTLNSNNDPQTLSVYYSKNKCDWTTVKIFDESVWPPEDSVFAIFLSRFRGNFDLTYAQLIETDTGYLARSTMYDSGYMPRYDDSGKSIGSMIYLLDKNFDITKEILIKGGGYVSAMSYVDGVCYTKQHMGYHGIKAQSVVTEEKYFCSTDFENWTECKGMPVVNGNHMIYISAPAESMSYVPAYTEMGAEYRELIWDLKNGEASTFKNGNPEYNVEYEAFSISNIKTLGEYFIGEVSYEDGRNAGKLALSKDGIYFTLIDLPSDELFKLWGAYELEDGRFLFEFVKQIWNTGSVVYTCNGEDLENEVRTGDIYVRYGDKILGFETPPVMENDRTLVPMRFLFEQMGASVDWNPETETATATLTSSARGGGGRQDWAGESNAVTFSIDDTTAIVNGEPNTMDVPARLINDKTMVPLRFLSENLGYTVTWDEATNTAIIEN